MTVDDILSELKELGSEHTRHIFMEHGVSGQCYGVKVGDMKVIQKRVKKNQELALELFNTGVLDAMYLAGLIAEPQKMTRQQLQEWVKNGKWYMIWEYTVAWMAAESKYGWELALEWIESKNEGIATAGWSTLSSLVALKQDSELDIEELKRLLQHVQDTIHQSPNRVRYTMNNFVISVGCYVKELTGKAMAVADKMGKVSVNMGGTACKVPDAVSYINKVIDKGYLGKKRKTVVC
ncbi:MAG: DNA alkylation repair protein [Taibaiella sp.]|nr:DNA alkylation repair protein [Taibaiella sp.]